MIGGLPMAFVVLLAVDAIGVRIACARFAGVSISWRRVAAAFPAVAEIVRDTRRFEAAVPLVSSPAVEVHRPCSIVPMDIDY